MVKNAFGGSKSKSIARKHESALSHNHVRMVQDPSEKYAIVRKIFGGSICQVFCHDLISRQAIIRGKFRGKGKRNNIISPGTLVLVGLRDFSHSSTCDILEVYSSFEFDFLSQKPSFPSFISIDNNLHSDSLDFHYELHDNNPLPLDNSTTLDNSITLDLNHFIHDI